MSKRARAVGLRLLLIVLALAVVELPLRLLTRSGTLGAITLLPYSPTAALEAGRALDFERAYLVFDPRLGWTVGPARRSSNGLYESTAHGARRDPGRPDPTPGQASSALTFGDSFTHCDDVSGDETWQAHLSSRVDGPIVNFGVPGFGVDQAMLRYQTLKEAWPSERVLIGFMADNIGRHLNHYRPFISPDERIFFAKPRFVIRDDRLELLEHPFKRLDDYFAPGVEAKLAGLAVNDHWYRPEMYSSSAWDHLRIARLVRTIAGLRPSVTERWRSLYADPEAEELTVRLLSAFVEEVRGDGRRAIVVFFPDQTFYRDAVQGRRLAAPLLGRLAASGIEVIDLTDMVVAFLAEESDPQAHFLPHYSSAMNQVVAIHLAEVLTTAHENPSSRAQ